MYMKAKRPIVYLILDNIRSVHNTGSIFRIADTIGINKIFCIGTTPTPIDRFNRKRQDFVKVSLGAEDTVSWEHIIDFKNINLSGFKIIALEQHKDSIDYKNINLDKENKIAIAVGNEVDGVSKEILKKADIIAEIPQIGQKESLNVSVATGIFLYRLLDK